MTAAALSLSDLTVTPPVPVLAEGMTVTLSSQLLLEGPLDGGPNQLLTETRGRQGCDSFGVGGRHDICPWWRWYREATMAWMDAVARGQELSHRYIESSVPPRREYLITVVAENGRGSSRNGQLRYTFWARRKSHI